MDPQTEDLTAEGPSPFVCYIVVENVGDAAEVVEVLDERQAEEGRIT